MARPRSGPSPSRAAMRWRVSRICSSSASTSASRRRRRGLGLLQLGAGIEAVLDPLGGQRGWSPGGCGRPRPRRRARPRAGPGRRRRAATAVDERQPGLGEVGLGGGLAPRPAAFSAARFLPNRSRSNESVERQAAVVDVALRQQLLDERREALDHGSVRSSRRTRWPSDGLGSSAARAISGGGAGRDQPRLGLRRASAIPSAPRRSGRRAGRRHRRPTSGRLGQSAVGAAKLWVSAKTSGDSTCGLRTRAAVRNAGAGAATLERRRRPASL